MGFNDIGSSSGAVPGGNLTKPVMIALGALLVGHMLSTKTTDAVQPSQDTDPVPTDAGSGGFLGKIFSGLQAGGNHPLPPVAAGNMGGLGGLLQQLAQSGHADKVNSWVSDGDNLPIEPDHLGEVLGHGKISDLARQAGVPEQELLAQLSQALPGVVDQLTENGAMPNMQQLLNMFGRS